MKHFFKTSALALLVLAASCSKDEGTSNKDLDKEIAEKEKTPIAAALVTDNVTIQGATKEEGTPPAPNGPISFDISNTSKTALLNEGFEISLDSDSNVVGAYVQFKTNDGTVADSYYDININDNYSNKSAKKSFTRKGKKAGLISKVDTDVVIDVDFKPEIEPGTFCYTICVYDGEGYVSAPSDVCVTVESWGGNSDLVATWNLTKEEYNEDGQGDKVDIATELECVTEIRAYSCEIDEIEGEEEIEMCNALISSLSIKADGTYVYMYEYSYTNVISETIDDLPLEIECVLGYEAKTYTYKETSEGNWSYIDGTNELILIEYKYGTNETFSGEFEIEEYEKGNADILLDGSITLEGNSFVTNEVFDGDLDGISDEYFKSFYKK